MILEIDQNFPQPAIIEQMVEIIKSRHAVFAYPTDTVYGLGCDIFDEEAIKKLSVIKKRSAEKNYSILVSDFKMLKQYATVTSAQEKILAKYLPGPYTFILKAVKKIPAYLLGENGTIGIRIPRNRFCLELVKNLKHPIITTSFNISDSPVITDPDNISLSLKRVIDVILDAGELGSVGSTIIDLTGKKPVVLRKGRGKL